MIARYLLPLAAMLLVATVPSAAQDHLDVETIFKRFLVTGDPSIGQVIINSGDTVYGTFCRAMAAKEPGEKVALLTRFIQAGPRLGLGDAYTWRGLFNNTLGNYDSSLADLTKAVALDEKSVYAHYFLGDTYTELKQQERAYAEFTRCIQLDSSFYLAYHMRGIRSYHMKHHAEAIEDFTAAIELGNYDQAYLMRGLVYNELKDYKKALSDWEEGVELNEKNADEEWLKKARANAEEMLEK